MRVVVIGATGHIGTFLVPRLVESGHDVVAVSRGTREPYRESPLWDRVERVRVDRDAEDAAGTFADRIAALSPRSSSTWSASRRSPRVTSSRAPRTRAAPRAHRQHLDPRPQHLPATARGRPEGAVRRVRRAEGGDRALPDRRVAVGRRAVHGGAPGSHQRRRLARDHARGQPRPAVWTALATGGPLAVPGSGSETMHHVHADDVAQVVQLAIANRETSVGELPRRLGPRALGARLRPGGSRLVRPRARAGAPRLGRLPRPDRAGSRRRQLGAPQPQPRREHRQGPRRPRLRAPVHERGGRTRGGRVDGPRGRAGRPAPR